MKQKGNKLYYHENEDLIISHDVIFFFYENDTQNWEINLEKFPFLAEEVFSLEASPDTPSTPGPIVGIPPKSV